jgi:hypothetical protein
LETRVLRQESWNGLSGQESRDRTARTGQPGKESQNRTAAEESRIRIARLEKERGNRMART